MKLHFSVHVHFSVLPFVQIMIETVLPFFISAALKFLVGIWGYSGQSTPPMYGDKGIEV